jgi:hypothetical protein
MLAIRRDDWHLTGQFIDQMPALFFTYGLAMALILSVTVIESSRPAPVIAVWFFEGSVSIAARVLIFRRMVRASSLQVASSARLRLLPVFGIVLAAIHWVWTATLFMGPQLNTTTAVFTFKGKPVVQVSTAAWYKAMRRAGIENFRWHDLRHTWASWHVQSGTPLNVLQELGGWASYAMVQRYAHLAADHLAPWADRLTESRTRRGTNLAQPAVAQRLTTHEEPASL